VEVRRAASGFRQSSGQTMGLCLAVVRAERERAADNTIVYYCKEIGAMVVREVSGGSWGGGVFVTSELL
jgi:hypothetical protein